MNLSGAVSCLGENTDSLLSHAIHLCVETKRPGGEINQEVLCDCSVFELCFDASVSFWGKLKDSS